MRSYWKHFSGSTVFAVLALVAAFVLGYQGSGSVAAGIASLVTALMLGVLETSLSFDNAVVNARILATMSPFWRKMYLTLGMVISVFGMRVFFPLAIVWAVGTLPFGDVLAMTWQNPRQFQTILAEQHVMIAGFGGAFLWMVFAKFFFDEEKEIHWVPFLEPVMSRIGRIDSFPVVVTLAVTYGFYSLLPTLHRVDFLVAAVFGTALYLVVSGLGAVMRAEKLVVGGAAGIGSFLFLEVQDASFSFDGVIGAFAITNNLFLIALGLGIGAFFVRSMTVKLVDDQTLGAFRYLEHGAFWAIGALATILYLGALGVEIHEIVSGSIGLVFIALSFGASVRHNRLRARSS